MEERTRKARADQRDDNRMIANKSLFEMAKLIARFGGATLRRSRKRYREARILLLSQTLLFPRAILGRTRLGADTIENSARCNSRSIGETNNSRTSVIYLESRIEPRSSDGDTKEKYEKK